MLRTRSIAIPVLVLAVLTACSDGDDGPDTISTTSTRAATGPTELSVSGVVTRAGGDPAAATEVPFEGQLDCGAEPPAGTGVFADNAFEACNRIADDPDVFIQVGTDPDRICTEIYGGPQTAHIEGTVNGTAVGIDVARNDGCGIDDWTRLEFLLGPPEQ